MEKCPYCLADTRPGDNFCLNCGNRLVPAASSPANGQTQPGFGDATLAAPDEWAAPMQMSAGSSPSGSGSNWSDSSETMMNTSADSASTQRSDVGVQTMDRIEQPAQFIVRSDSGEVLSEYTLEKAETTIGRAPTSDILLSKDKLTSRRHATVHYENGEYSLRDEGSANSTFVNGQQIEPMTPHILHDGDHIGIGEHELIFRAYNSPSINVEDLPTRSISYDDIAPEMTYRTREDPAATGITNDDFQTRPEEEAVLNQQTVVEEEPVAGNSGFSDVNASYTPPAPPPASAPSIPVPTSFASASPSIMGAPSSASQMPPPTPRAQPAVTNDFDNAAVSSGNDTGVTFNRITSLQQPSLPDLTALMAALSTLDGQVMSLQEQFNATQDSIRQHETDVAQTANQLRAGVKRVSDRMDSTIADVARSRDALAWAELRQLMEDVMNNPRDIEYVTKLARKARELNKLFEIQQNVLNTMAECNSLLRSLIGEDR